MEKREFNIKQINEILAEIKEDTFTLMSLGIPDPRINIAIPKYFQTVMSNYFSNYDNDFKTLFSFAVVDGYNKQICVFDRMADPRFSVYLEPIEIKL